MRFLLALFVSCALTTPALAGTALLERTPDGHFWADAHINGRTVRVLVDTGATLVALTPDDARRAGVDMYALSYTQPVGTAAGPTMGAYVRLDRISIGGATLDNVDAMVIKGGLAVSILGMSYLKRLSQMDVRGDSMRLAD